MSTLFGLKVLEIVFRITLKNIYITNSRVSPNFIHETFICIRNRTKITYKIIRNRKYLDHCQVLVEYAQQHNI